MNCFQLIKTVLDEQYQQIELPKKKKDREIKRRFKHISEQYGNLGSGNPIELDYSDPITRFAYIYKYTTSHANYVYQLVRESGELRDLFKRDPIRIACIGGGPGSDFLGILKFAMDIKMKKKTLLKCMLFDKEEAWGESWSDVDEKLSAPFRLSTQFRRLDVTDDESWKIYTKF